ncbi:cytochrome P450 [Ganoderma sinense ZZ0214-1]|uniref:Cytochrome P450 n=1 Tax=Ganoderma sinense ZZ0214-1 TaxID=1077348 RepID=A0A2G8RT48_9APHY|nr:cytochrome P450 [Ganoderma sinense ZZ0214-1]
MVVAFLPTVPTLAGIVIAFAFLYSRYLAAWRARSRRLPLPPGPKPLPIIDNMLDWPTNRQWVVFRDMCAQYGDILHLKILGQHIVVLGSPEAISELLEKRSANTSDRPQVPLMELTGIDASFSAMPYGQWWRRHKRAFWQHFNPGAIPSYQPIQRRGAHKFLNKLLKTPSELRDHIRFTFSATIVKVVFGIDVADDGDEIMAIVEAALEWVGETFTPGKYLIDALPILQHVPTWVPGATVQRLIVYWRSTIMRLKEEPYRLVKAAMSRNEATESMVSQLIARMIGGGDDPSAEDAETIIQNVAMVAVEAASDTMFSTVQTIFVAMSLYPEVQRKAQAELDAVVGPNRLPDFEDRDALVYVNAIIKEALRWQNVLPFVLPHMTLEEDEYRGYFIPGGTLLIPNVAAYMHDPNVYEDPDIFRPERFIRDGRLDFSAAPDPAKFIFGFGRRICPGRHFGMNGLFINVASVLHVFNITPPVDEKGQVIKIEPQLTSGLLCYPADCRCTIKPRSAQAEALIHGTRVFD